MGYNLLLYIISTDVIPENVVHDNAKFFTVNDNTRIIIIAVQREKQLLTVQNQDKLIGRRLDDYNLNVEKYEGGIPD